MGNYYSKTPDVASVDVVANTNDTTSNQSTETIISANIETTTSSNTENQSTETTTSTTTTISPTDQHMAASMPVTSPPKHTFDPKNLAKLLTSGYDVFNIIDGHTLLTEAAEAGDYEQCLLLLRYGSDPNPALPGGGRFLDRNPVLKPSVKRLLEIADRANPALISEMNEKLDECLSVFKLTTLLPPHLCNYIRDDPLKNIQDWLQFVQYISFVDENLGREYGLLWMVNNNSFM